MQKDILVLLVAVMQPPYFLNYFALVSFTINPFDQEHYWFTTFKCYTFPIIEICSQNLLFCPCNFVDS